MWVFRPERDLDQTGEGVVVQTLVGSVHPESGATLEKEFQADIDSVYVGRFVIGEDEVVFVVQTQSDPIVDDDVDPGAGGQAKVAGSGFGGIHA